MIQEQYSPKQIEASMQQQWTKDNAYRAVEHAKNADGSEKPKFYACSMLPYPSGKLHMGHVRNYTINDVMYRQLRMRGYNVLMPMGWDAFGMPAENAAIKSQVPPAQWTYENIAYMKKQMQAMGLGIDWEREIAACSPDYYRWTQWLFLKMLEKGIAYRKTQMVNWDPVDQTVLANEQVIDGRGWRSGALVEKREIPGYYLNITKYAEELLAHLPKLEGWPEKVRLMQEHWIGKSEGVRFAFPHKITNADGSLVQDGKLYVFTTRVDTIFGVTFCAVAPEHPLAQYAAKTSPAIADFIETCKKGGVTEAELATKEKEGIDTGLTVIHPLTQQAIPVWIGNYVLMSYGDGAVMGVPAHDERDFAFAQKYQLTIQPVMHLEGQTYDATQWQDWYGDKDKTVTIHSGEYSGLSHKAAVQAIAKALEAQQLGNLQTTYRLRDWGISRQRYWGTPIPMIHCADCGTVPVPEADLPVVLPENLIPDGSGNPLAKCETFLRCQCPKCGKEARRETDTMDTFLDSSWYFLRYTAADNSNAMVDERTNYWMPMDQYIGGIEHAVLHLLYARFWTKVMRDLGLIQTDEPFTNLLTQGMVLNTIYSRKNEKGAVEYFWESEIEHQYDDKHAIIGSHLKKDGTPVDRTLGTMSKSKNNGVDPQSLIDSMGADTARLFVMFASPPEQTLEWSDSGVDGSHRFLKRLWAFAYQHQARLAKGIIGTQSVVWSETDKALKLARRDIHQILQQAQFDYERMQYNTVVSAGMKLLNTLEEVAKLAQLDQAHQDACLAEGFSILVRLLYPIIPHMTAHLWQSLALEPQQLNLLDATWPQVDPKALITDEIELVLQINGKLRGSLTIARDLDKASIEALACAHDAVKRHLGDAAPKRIIVVPGKLVNIVG